MLLAYFIKLYTVSTHVSPLLQLAYNGQVHCVQISDENLTFQHYQMVCHTICTGIVCLVYYWLRMKQQFPALLLVICKQNM
jgi:hypothetical protein